MSVSTIYIKWTCIIGTSTYYGNTYQMIYITIKAICLTIFRKRYQTSGNQWKQYQCLRMNICLMLQGFRWRCHTFYTFIYSNSCYSNVKIGQFWQKIQANLACFEEILLFLQWLQVKWCNSFGFGYITFCNGYAVYTHCTNFPTA